MGERKGSNDNGRRSDTVLDIIDIHSEVSQAVLQETRLRILAVLASPEAIKRGGYSLQELGQILDCSAQNAHHHLKILEKAGAAYVSRSEATQRIPRQFWTTDVRKVRIRPAAESTLEVDMGVSAEGLRRLSRKVRGWARDNGTVEHEEVALQVATFLSQLDGPAADHLLHILKENHEAL